MSENQKYGSNWTSTLSPQQEEDVNKFYEEQIKPFFDDGEGLGDKKCQGCEDCDCDIATVPSYTGHRDVDVFLHDTLEIMRKKGHDYRQGNDADLLHNFRTVAKTVDEPMMKVWFTYFYKHYAALATYIKNDGQSESEPIEGRISDLIVYLLLFHEMVQQNKRAEEGIYS